jgi:hypothetical protein
LGWWCVEQTTFQHCNSLQVSTFDFNLSLT